MGDKIIQASGFPYINSSDQSMYLLVAVTEYGRVLMSEGDGRWADITGDAMKAFEQSGRGRDE